MTEKQKSKLLKKAIDAVLANPNIVDGESGGADPSGVSIWILMKEGDSHVIYCWNFDWSEKLQGWVDEPISEMEGPALLNCPIRFFNHNFKEEDVFESWRYEVKRFHEHVGPPVQDDEVAHRLIHSLKNKHRK